MHDQAAAAIWSDPETLTTPLTVLAVDRYGPKPDDRDYGRKLREVLDWHPTTWRHEIHNDTNVDLEDQVLSRLMVGVLHLRSPDRFYHDPADFEFMCRILSSGAEPIPHHGDLALIEEVCWGCLEAYLLCPPDSGWSPAVSGYCRAACQEVGLAEAPSILKALKVVTEIPKPPDLGEPYADKGRQDTMRDVNALISSRAETMGEQLQKLPLRHGSVETSVKRLGQLQQLVSAQR